MVLTQGQKPNEIFSSIQSLSIQLVHWWVRVHLVVDEPKLNYKGFALVTYPINPPCPPLGNY
jgi:hypothetical protein